MNTKLPPAAHCWPMVESPISTPSLSFINTSSGSALRFGLNAQIGCCQPTRREAAKPTKIAFSSDLKCIIHLPGLLHIKITGLCLDRRKPFRFQLNLLFLKIDSSIIPSFEEKVKRFFKNLNNAAQIHDKIDCSPRRPQNAPCRCRSFGALQNSSIPASFLILNRADGTAAPSDGSVVLFPI